MKIRKALAAVVSIGFSLPLLTAILVLSSLFVTRPAFADAKTEAKAETGYVRGAITPYEHHRGDAVRRRAAEENPS